MSGSRARDPTWGVRASCAPPPRPLARAQRDSLGFRLPLGTEVDGVLLLSQQRQVLRLGLTPRLSEGGVIRRFVRGPAPHRGGPFRQLHPDDELAVFHRDRNGEVGSALIQEPLD